MTPHMGEPITSSLALSHPWLHRDYLPWSLSRHPMAALIMTREVTLDTSSKTHRSSLERMWVWLGAYLVLMSTVYQNILFQKLEESFWKHWAKWGGGGGACNQLFYHFTCFLPNENIWEKGEQSLVSMTLRQKALTNIVEKRRKCW